MTKTQDHKKEANSQPVTPPPLTRGILSDQGNQESEAADFIVGAVTMESIELKGAGLLSISALMDKRADTLEYEIYDEKKIKINSGSSNYTEFAVADLQSFSPLVLQIRSCQLQKTSLCGSWYQQDPITLKFTSPVGEQSVGDQSLLSQQIKLEQKIQKLGKAIYVELVDYKENLKKCGLPLRKPIPQDLLDKSLKIGPDGIAAGLLDTSNNCQVVEVPQNDGTKVRDLTCESESVAVEGQGFEEKKNELKKLGNVFVLGLGSVLFAGAIKKIGHEGVRSYAALSRKLGVSSHVSKGIGIVVVGSLIAYFVSANSVNTTHVVGALAEGISGGLLLAEDVSQIKDNSACVEVQKNVDTVVSHYQVGQQIRDALISLMKAIKNEVPTN